jgi:predicted nucleic acid-binding Zn ribbon protein
MYQAYNDSRKCLNCGDYLPRGITVRRKFCSDKCRLQHNRAQSLTALYGQAIQAISKMSKLPKGEHKKAAQSLKELKQAIDWELRALGDVDTVSRFEMLEDRNRINQNKG